MKAMGGLIPRARYKVDGNIAAKHRASEMEIHPGALLAARQLIFSRTYALPASTTAMENNPKNRPRRTAVRNLPIRLTTCLDRSAALPCRIRGNCLHGIALPSLAQAPVADAAPCADRAAMASGLSSGRSEPSDGLSPSGERRSLGERSKAVSEAQRTVAGHGRAHRAAGAGFGRRTDLVQIGSKSAIDVKWPVGSRRSTSLLGGFSDIS